MPCPLENPLQLVVLHCYRSRKVLIFFCLPPQFIPQPILCFFLHMVRGARATGTCSQNQTAAALAEKSGWGCIKPILIIRVIRKIITRKIIGCICSSSPPRHSGKLPDCSLTLIIVPAVWPGVPVCSSMGKGWGSSSALVLDVPLICPWHSRGWRLHLLAFPYVFLAWDHQVSRFYVSICLVLNRGREISFLTVRHYRKRSSDVPQLQRTDTHC